MKNIALVGYTGFVGSNLVKSNNFNSVYNSKNIEEAFGTNPDLLVYSGVPAEKFLANKDPENDFKIINNAMENIKKINPKAVVLISTIDVYKDPNGRNEDYKIDTEELQPYGLNRYYLEQFVEENFENHLIVRLPGLYGHNIKKNFIFDMIKIIPALLNENKYNELKNINSIISQYYVNQNNGFYKCKELNSEEKTKLKDIFNEIGFSALNFTDSRGTFQFYNLSYLWEHIKIALDNGIKKLNIATEPIRISELYSFVNEKAFINEVANVIPNYDYKTKHDSIFNGENGYIFNKSFVLNDIKKFIKEYEA